MSRLGPTVILSVSAAMLMLGVGMIVALLPQRVYAATGSLEAVGLVASVFAVAYLLAQMPIGVLSDRVGAKPLLIGGYVLCGLAGLIFYGWRGADAVLFARVVQGVGEAPVWALGPVILSLARPDTKGREIGIYNAAIHAGLMCGPIAGFLLSPTGQSQAPFLVFAVLAFAAAAITMVCLPAAGARSSARRSGGIRSLGRLLAVPDLGATFVGIVLYGAAYGTFLTVLPASLTLTHGFDARAASGLFVVFYAAIGLSQLVVGPLCDRFGRARFMAGGMVLACAGLAAFPAVERVYVYVPLAAASLGLGAFCVASLAELADRVPVELRGATSGSYYLAWGLGYVLGPLGIAALSANDARLGYDVLAGALALQVLVAWRLRR